MRVASPARLSPSGAISCQSTHPSWPKCTITCSTSPPSAVVAMSIILPRRDTAGDASADEVCGRRMLRLQRLRQQHVDGAHLTTGRVGGQERGELLHLG